MTGCGQAWPGVVSDWGSALSAIAAAVFWVRSARVPIPDMTPTADGGTGLALPAIRRSARLSQLAAWAAAVSAALAALGKMLPCP